MYSCRECKPFCFIFAIATSHPCPLKWELHHGIVPPEEDYFDYLPISAALWPDIQGLREFITLSTENASSFEFSDFKVKSRRKQLNLITHYIPRCAANLLAYSIRLFKSEYYHQSPHITQLSIRKGRTRQQTEKRPSPSMDVFNFL